VSLAILTCPATAETDYIKPGQSEKLQSDRMQEPHQARSGNTANMRSQRTFSKSAQILNKGKASQTDGSVT